MAVEASIDLLPVQDTGFPIPLSAVVGDGAGADNRMGVFVFVPETSSVTRRGVTVGGIRKNAIMVPDELQESERIAVAGVSFLKEGQQVRLLDGTE